MLENWFVLGLLIVVNMVIWLLVLASTVDMVSKKSYDKMVDYYIKRGHEDRRKITRLTKALNRPPNKNKNYGSY